MCVRGLDKCQKHHKLHQCVCNENKREIHPFHHLKGRYDEQVKPHAELPNMTSKPQIILLIYVWLERSGVRKDTKTQKEEKKLD